MRRAALFGGVLIISCHHRPNVEPMLLEQTYCWWSSQYLSVAPVWVASRFQESLTAAGFPRARSAHDADSAWATANLARFADAPAGTMYGFRIVAYAASDTARCAWRGVRDAPVARRPIGAESCLHTNVFIYSDGQTRRSADTDTMTSYVFPLCGKIYHLALGELEILK